MGCLKNNVQLIDALNCKAVIYSQVLRGNLYIPTCSPLVWVLEGKGQSVVYGGDPDGTAFCGGCD